MTNLQIIDPDEERFLASLDRAEQALTEAESNAELLWVKEEAQRAKVSAALKGKNHLVVKFQNLIIRADFELKNANPKLPKGTRTDLEPTRPDGQVKDAVLPSQTKADLHKTYDNIEPEEIIALTKKAEEDEEPLTRKAIMEYKEKRGIEEAIDEVRAEAQPDDVDSGVGDVLKDLVETGEIKADDAKAVATKDTETLTKASLKLMTGEARTMRAAVNKVENEQLAAAPPPLPQGKYRTVVIDPPWPMSKLILDARPNQVGFDYPVMELQEIYDLEINELLHDDAWVLLWTTQKFLPNAFEALEWWKLRYRFTMVWKKNGGNKIMGLPQYNCEFIVCGSKGIPTFVDETQFFTAFDAPRTGHSIKPVEFYQLIERVAPAPRLDMFSRRQLDGFEVWGNQAPTGP